MGEDKGGKRGGIFRNMYKGHMDNTKGRVGGRNGWAGRSVGGEMETTVLEQLKNNNKIKLN